MTSEIIDSNWGKIKFVNRNVGPIEEMQFAGTGKSLEFFFFGKKQQKKKNLRYSISDDSIDGTTIISNDQNLLTNLTDLVDDSRNEINLDCDDGSSEDEFKFNFNNLVDDSTNEINSDDPMDASTTISEDLFDDPMDGMTRMNETKDVVMCDLSSIVGSTIRINETSGVVVKHAEGKGVAVYVVETHIIIFSISYFISNYSNYY